MKRELSINSPVCRRAWSETPTTVVSLVRLVRAKNMNELALPQMAIILVVLSTGGDNIEAHMRGTCQLLAIQIYLYPSYSLYPYSRPPGSSLTTAPRAAGLRLEMWSLRATN